MLPRVFYVCQTHYRASPLLRGADSLIELSKMAADLETGLTNITAQCAESCWGSQVDGDHWWIPSQPSCMSLTSQQRQTYPIYNPGKGVLYVCHIQLPQMLHDLALFGLKESCHAVL